MQRQLIINFLVSVMLSIATVFVLYGDELTRRLGNYLVTYSVIWIVLVIALMVFSFKLVASPTLLKVIVMGIVVGYLSCVFAYIFAVMLDVSNIRNTGLPISGRELLIPFIFPFLVLKGWVFSVCFIVYALLLIQYRSKGLGSN